MKTFEKVKHKLQLAVNQGMHFSDEERFGLDQEIDEIFEEIAKAPNFESADKKLQELGLYQDILALLWYKYNALLSNKQRELVCDYDRWDDVRDRLGFYLKIRGAV